MLQHRMMRSMRLRKSYLSLFLIWQAIEDVPCFYRGLFYAGTGSVGAFEDWCKDWGLGFFIWIRLLSGRKKSGSAKCAKGGARDAKKGIWRCLVGSKLAANQSLGGGGRIDFSSSLYFLYCSGFNVAFIFASRSFTSLSTAALSAGGGGGGGGGACLPSLLRNASIALKKSL